MTSDQRLVMKNKRSASSGCCSVFVILLLVVFVFLREQKVCPEVAQFLSSCHTQLMALKKKSF